MSDPLAVLQRIRESRPREIPRAGEVCELCAEPIPDDHGHLVDLAERHLLCACRGCYLLFLSEGAGGSHFRSVPERYLAFPDCRPLAGAMGQLADSGRRGLLLPQLLPGPRRRVLPGTRRARPSPSSRSIRGPRSSQPTPPSTRCSPTWRRSWCAARTERGGTECYIVPIDACYELVGHLRRLWRGFDGGQEANAKLDAFFDDLRAKAR